jgi:hypothetical protein
MNQNQDNIEMRKSFKKNASETSIKIKTFK